MAQAFIFINLVNVGPLLLLACICAAVLGAWLGAPIVARMSVRKIRIGMGCALAVAAVVFALSNLGWMPAAAMRLICPAAGSCSRSSLISFLAR